MSCVALFTISSFLCGMAPTLSSLVLFRVVPIQTLSYAGIPPQKFNQVSGMVNLSRNHRVAPARTSPAVRTSRPWALSVNRQPAPLR